MHYFEFFISVLIKNLKMDSSFLEFLFEIFEKIKFDLPVFSKPVKPVPTDFTGFHQNFNPCSRDLRCHKSKKHHQPTALAFMDKGRQPDLERKEREGGSKGKR
jgi:hypothetical protein